MDFGGSPTCTLPNAASQDSVGRCARQVNSAGGSRAVVLLSGGLDSATVLAIARSQNYECYALSVEYGQRHRAELDAARRIAAALGAHEHRTMRVDLAGIGGSALTDAKLPVPEVLAPGI